MYIHVLRCLFLACILALCAGCDFFVNPYNPPPPPPGGFKVQILDQTAQGIIGEHLTGSIHGDWVKDIGTTQDPSQGSTYHFDAGAPWPENVSGGRAPAFWQGTVKTNDWCLDPIVFPNGTGWSGNVTAIGSTFAPLTCFPPGASSAVFYSNAIPATITIQASGLTTSQGMPKLTVTDVKEAQVAQVTATSVATDGSSASFPFPKQSNGSALPSGVYGFNVANQTAPGALVEQAANFFSLGTLSTSFTTPYGVDALNSVSTSSLNGVPGPTYLAPYAIATFSSTNMISTDTRDIYTVGVGTQPVAIKGYGIYTVGGCGRGTGNCSHNSKPRFAIVANSGSGTVSIVDLVLRTVLATITVGSQPVSIILNNTPAKATKAYVANLGSGNVSEIDLAHNTQSRTVTVGSSPAALVMDPAGASFWVGGNGYVSQVDIASFTVSSNFPVSGQVTSLLVSSGQNVFVYTVVDTNKSNFMVQTAKFKTGALMNTEYQTNFSQSSKYAETAAAGGLPGWLMSSGALVSSSYGNRYYAAGTPTGYVVVDLQTNTQMLQGSTASPVRGIATDPVQGTIYVAAPESNSFITVPLYPAN
jgi:YVTN family beta-propeller protein